MAIVANLEGLRALEESRVGDAEVAMQEVLVLAAGLTFLSNENVSSLPARLREAGLCLDLCRAFDELVEKKDWRELGQ